MGRKKACFKKETYICIAKDCPFFPECSLAITKSEKKLQEWESEKGK